MEKRIRIPISALLVAVVCLAVAAQVIAQPSPFVISGWVTANGGEPCNDSAVQITNMDTLVGWYAENSSTSNYYQLVLDSEDVSADNLLRFNVSGCNQLKTVEYTVTQSDIDDGGIFEFNIPPDTDWKQFHYDIANTGNSPAKVPGTNQTKWITDNIGAVASSQAMIVGDKVLVYGNDHVVALSKSSGAILWNTSIPGDTQGWGSWASPAYDDDMLFVSAGYNLTKLNATGGAKLQEIAFPDGMYSCNGGPTVADGMVFAGSGYAPWGDPSPTHYYAFNESDLTDVKWNFATGASEAATSTPAVAANKVVFGNGSSLTCVNETNGNVIWSTPLNAHGSETVGSSAAIDVVNDGVYVTTYIWSGPGTLYALNFTNGNEEWNATILYTDSTPTISGDYIYVSGDDNAPGVTYCFNSAGALQPGWPVPCGSWTMSPAIADGKLFTGKVGTGADGICVFDATTGTPLWNYDDAGSSPSVAESDGMVVSIGNDGKVYVFGEKEVFQFDTGKPVNPYPSIFGTHYGKIIPDQNITVNKIYTYPCTGTGGHTEHAKIWNGTIGKCAVADWNGYQGDYHNLTFNTTLTLEEGVIYNYIIETGSYPQIIHAPYKQVNGGNITCDSFEDANGKEYDDWIPAFRLWYAA